MLRGAQTVVNREKTSTRVSRQDCQKTTQHQCQKTSFRNRAEQYWLRPLCFAQELEFKVADLKGGTIEKQSFHHSRHASSISGFGFWVHVLGVPLISVPVL